MRWPGRVVVWFLRRRLSHKRLENAVKQFSVELDRLSADASVEVKAEGERIPPAWVGAAKKHLENAKKALEISEVDPGWQSLHAAQREIVYGYTPAELADATATIREEAKDKLSNWRGRAITKLLNDKDGFGKLLSGGDTKTISESRKRLHDAMEIRDESYATQYYKIALRQRNLIVVFIVCVILLFALPVMSSNNFFPSEIGDWKRLATIEIMGILGAFFSVIRLLTASKVKGKIPDQVLGSVVTWVRPVVGSIAAVATYFFFKAGFLDSIFSTSITSKDVGIYSVAFASGFSERIIVNVMANISEDVKPGKPMEERRDAAET